MMKKTFAALTALLAVSSLAAGTLADFSNGMGCVYTTGSVNAYETAPVVAVVEDAKAPGGHALLAKIAGVKEGSKFGRYDVVVKLKPEEAAKIREISFDVKVSGRKSFGWSVIYFFKARRIPDIRSRSIPGKDFKIGEWQHFTFPVDSFKAEGKGIEMNEARIFVISFFTYAPVEIAVANIAYAE